VGDVDGSDGHNGERRKKSARQWCGLVSRLDGSLKETTRW
jgi:hypothetical protein